MERIDIKTKGTYIFDVVLLVLALMVTIAAIVVSLRMIAAPTQKVSHTLEEIVTSIQNNEGDLTARVSVDSNDEIGRMASGINEFVGLLQDNMITMRQSADRLKASMGIVVDKVMKLIFLLTYFICNDTIVKQCLYGTAEVCVVDLPR